MIEYFIKTWSCACGYQQDFEPTQELVDKHFNDDKLFPLDDVKADECPSCKLKGLVGSLKKETDPAKKSKHRIFQDSDRAVLEASIAKADKDVIEDGKTRPETQQEKDARVVKEISELRFPSDAEIAKLRAEHEDV